MKLQFYAASKALEGHLADVQIIFEEAGLRGLTLAGIALWEDGKGIAVRMPRSSYGRAEGETARFFYFLRGDKAAIDKLKGTIVGEFLRLNPQIARALVSERGAEPRP